MLHAEVGQCLIIARRQGDVWYVGGMNADEPSEHNLPLTFLGDGSFDAEIFLDDEPRGPAAVRRREGTVSRVDRLQVEMPKSGGFVARLEPGPG